MDERTLIADCRTGNRKAQKQLFELYSRGMLLVCLRYVKNQQDAEELMLNGFHKFFQSLDIFIYSGNGSIGAWLKKIIVNECLMFLRKNKAFIQDIDEQTESLVLEAGMVEQMHAAEIMSWIRQLPDGYRTVFNLFVIEGYNHKEIAALLHISEGTSKSQLNKARSYLQKIMQQKETVYERN